MKRNECKEKEYAKSEEGGTEGTRNKAMRYLLAEKQTLRWRFAGFGWISESSVGCMWSEESMEAEENRRIQNKTKQIREKKREGEEERFPAFAKTFVSSFFVLVFVPLSLSHSLSDHVIPSEFTKENSTH